MGIHEHKAKTKTDRLIAAVEALTRELNYIRSAGIAHESAITSINGRLYELESRQSAE